jgi:hypothetical protein
MFAPDSFTEIAHGRSSLVLLYLATQLYHVAMHEGLFSTGFLTDVAPAFHNLRPLTLITCAFFYRATAVIDSQDSHSSQHCARVIDDMYGITPGGATPTAFQVLGRDDKPKEVTSPDSLTTTCVRSSPIRGGGFKSASQQ